MIEPEQIDAQNAKDAPAHDEDFAALGRLLARRGIDIEDIVDRTIAFGVAIPSWGVGTGGTRFARFPGPGEPRNIEEKLADCAVVHALTRSTPTVSLHVPWDAPADAAALREYAAGLGLGFDAMNSNTFQDRPGQPHSYKFGSLTHSDAEVRAQAVAHNIECIEIGKQLGSRALTVWIGDGGNLPGQQHFRKTLDRYLESLERIYRALPEGWRLFLEHKLYEPAFYSTVNNDWGTSYVCAKATGERCACLVDLGHHAPTVNIEMIVARLIQLGKLGGFHLNDSKYGDDDLDTGSIAPFRLFLVFAELVGAEREGVAGFDPAYMLDQSHNVTDPVESLIISAGEARRARAKALLIDFDALAEHQDANDVLAAQQTLKAAYEVDVEPILAEARRRTGAALNPIAVYRASGYRARVTRERPNDASSASGIV